jgi:hypothetical protein
MVAEVGARSRVSATCKLTLLVDQNWSVHCKDGEARTREFLAVVNAVANEEQAIALRRARLLAWAKTKDLQQAGYPSWKAFVKEHSPWSLTRTYEFVGLVESQLDVIKEAVSNNELGVTVATRAPTELGNEASREAQLAWIRAAQREVFPERQRACMGLLSGDDMRRVVKARKLGAILKGGDPSTAAIDAFLLDCHSEKRTCDQIVETARAAPPVPERLGREVPDWKPPEPADSLLGPWVEPTDLTDAVAKLRATAALPDLRQALLGMAYFLIKFHYLWTNLPECDSLEELCVVHLAISQRTLQRYARVGLALFQRPRLRKEVEEGRLTLDRAMFVADHAGGTEAALDKWVELVRRLGRAEMQLAQERDEDHLKEYGPALAMAREVEALVRQEKEPEATRIGATAASIADHLRAVGATGPILVAVRDDRNRKTREPASIFVPPKLLAAADYVLETVVLPPVYGTRRMVEHDRYTCQNPRCRRITLRVHPHHMDQRQHGGTDHPANIVTLCPACHLRGIHSNQMSVVRRGDWLVWTWPDGGAVLMDSPVSALVYQRRSTAVLHSV